jgi:hypothetical protein
MGCTRVPWRATALYFGLSLMLAAMHGLDVDFGPNRALAERRHDAILAGRGESPYAYRVLMPALAEAAKRALEPAFGPERALAAGYAGWRWAATFAFFLLFHAYLRAWLDEAWTTAGVLLAAALHPATFRFYWYQPDSPTDLLVWTAAGVLTQIRRDRWLFPLVVVGTLNRETAVFVIGVHAALRWGSEARSTLALRCGGLLATFAATFVGLRAAIGLRPWVAPIGELARANLNRLWLEWAAVFLGSLTILPFLGISRRPPELRRLAALLLATYLPLLLVFGRIREVRLLLPLVLPLVPLAMLSLREEVRGEPEVARPGTEG